ncbi:MAG: hypothetical protein J6U17_03100 [Kiritimatiellae bacterium]|nr:hypothetical protein [Kiritimatiellia bacterium]
MTETRLFPGADAAREYMERTFRHYADPASVAPLKGDAAHEVAVGPVHAGVIEPGHFRFQCMGEDVYNLQIFLGYQRRGVEERIVAADGNVARQVALAETCAGDTSVAAATCISEILERRNGSAPGAAALAVRSLLLELERVANHVGDLGALAGDVAFLPTASFCGRIRGEYLNMTALLCGNRFGRNAVIPGGARVTLDAAKRDELARRIRDAKRDLDGALGLMFEEPTVLERLEHTGTVPRDVAERIGLVGVARRASVELNGDVLSRAQVRRMEIEEAHGRIAALLAGEAPERTQAAEPSGEGPFSVVASTVAAWRGPLVHAALFDDARKMVAYRIIDPSARNWPGLAWALRGEQISNFPICNKSFNLSYCGTDR